MYMKNRNLNRWLIIRNGAVGDTVLLSPVVQSIRAALPDAWIEVMGHVERVELLVGEGMANQAVAFDQPGMESLFSVDGQPHQRLQEYFAGFDAVLYFGYVHSDALPVKLRQRQDQVVVTHPPLPKRDDIHITEHYLKALNGLIEYENAFVPRIVLREEEKKRGKEWLENHSDYDGSLFLLGLHVGAGSQEKMASFDLFLQAIEALKNKAILLIPKGPADGDAVSGFLNHLGGDYRYVILEGMRLRQLAAVLSHCGRFMGNDSGITHVSSAMKIPTTVFFVRSNPKVWRPLGEHVRVEVIGFESGGPVQANDKQFS